MRYGLVAWCGLLIALAGLARALADEPPAVEKPEQEVKPKVYDEQADAQEQIAAALKIANRDDKRVLLVFGGNWCGWCIKLHKAFDENHELSRLLRYEYSVAWIDSQQLKEHKDLDNSFGERIGKHGVPFLVVLDRDGAVLTTQDTGSLEDGPKHDSEKVIAFLKAWVVPPSDAEKLLADAQSRARAEDKSVFVYFSTPTCGWCLKLTDFLAAYAAAFDRDYVSIKIDLVRMTNSREVAKRLGCEERKGVPWEAVVDGKGDLLATSDGPEGNIGYPATTSEIGHFMSMLKKTARHATPEQIAEIDAALRRAAPQ